MIFDYSIMCGTAHNRGMKLFLITSCFCELCSIKSADQYFTVECDRQ